MGRKEQYLSKNWKLSYDAPLFKSECTFLPDFFVQLEQKKEYLISLLRGYQRVAIAFSGGVDSSLLAGCALEALGDENVLLIFGRSPLLKQEEIEHALGRLSLENGRFASMFEVVDLNPLQWADFIRNDKERCYVCKHRLYRCFIEKIKHRGHFVFCDGTNADDVRSNRPGLRAIEELGVQTPLAKAGLNKFEVRALGRQLGLVSWQRPSASCLATRIPTHTPITQERLRRIEFLEAGLEKMGFVGCRVRLLDPDEKDVLIELTAMDFKFIESEGVLSEIFKFFRNNGVRKVMLDLEARMG